MKRSESTRQACPKCSAEIPVNEGYAVWCANCNWNLRDDRLRPAKNLYEKIYVNIGRRSSKSLFDSMVESKFYRPRITASKALAFALATFIYLATLAIIPLGIFGVMKLWPSPFAIFVGIIALGILFVTRPRFAKMPDGVLSREKFPVLYGLCDRVSDAIGTKRLSAVATDSGFNAFYTQVGLRQRRVVCIGYPLMRILSPQELVAVIGHEVSHGANGDLTHGIILGTAIDMLDQWYRLLRPDRLFGYRKATAGPIGPLLDIPTNFVMASLAFFPWLGSNLFARLVWRETQCAEYLADMLATSAAGTAAMVSSLQKMKCRSTYKSAVQRTALSNGSVRLFEDLPAQFNAIPRHELERLNRIDKVFQSTLDATHPPTLFRMQYLESNIVKKPHVELSVSEIESLMAEMKSLEGEFEQRILDQYRESLMSAGGGLRT